MKTRTLALLGSVIVVCLVLLTIQTRGHASRTADLLALVTTPVQKGLAVVHRGAFGFWSTYVDWKNVRGENRRLREEIQRLRVEALAVTETAEENRRLRRLLDLRARLPLETLPGEIIAREWGGWVRSLTVNRGRADDVRRLTAVISPDGLVGRVVDVRPGASVVQVLTDPASTVGAHLLRTRAPGIVEGEPRGTIRFKYMARDGAGLQVGDLVVTSGQGGMFPRGIPIGRVRAIDDRGAALFSYAHLTPVVDFARIDEVLLVTGDRMQDMTAYFPRGG
ncbi:MAG TPA: rod shape-determining protein MreC [Methylomirabilota bacterium]|nr:rod shape-determining protein MreC [Methylomirabilota bacterium]